MRTKNKCILKVFVDVFFVVVVMMPLYIGIIFIVWLKLKFLVFIYLVVFENLWCFIV